MTYAPPVRIGLSATQKPIEQVAHFLTGNGRADPVIVNIGHKRTLDLAVEVPPMPLGPVASNEMWDAIYDRLVTLVNEHRSTLVFVNTRRMAERLAHNLGERMGEENVAAHHGSLSRKLRLAAEKKLKEGQIRVLVATASLELGIDVGTVDLAVQINSPRSIAVALQRVGRSGHWRGAIPKGRFFCTTRDDLLECASLARAIQHGDLDRLIIPEAPLDVLAQQIVAACSAEEFREDDMFALVRRAYPYRNLSREVFDSILEMLSEGIAAKRGRYGAYVHRDRVNGKLRARRGARLAAITSGGAIPDNSLYSCRRTRWHRGRHSGRRFRRRKHARRHHAARQYVVDDSPHRDEFRTRAGAGRARLAAERSLLEWRGSVADRRIVRTNGRAREKVSDRCCHTPRL